MGETTAGPQERADWTHSQWHPCLKPHDWRGADHAACHPLLATEEPVPEMPWVAVCRDLPEQIIFPPREELSDLQLQQLGPLSMGNLSRQEVKWKVQEVAQSLLLVGRGPFASELVLTPDIAALAAEKLGVKGRFVAACPRRGVLLIRDAQGPGLQAFQSWVAHLYYAEEHAPIMPFCVLLGPKGIQGVLRDTGALALGKERAGTQGTQRIVQVVGYQSKTQTLLLSCAPSPGQGLPPTDIQWMQKIVDEGEFQGRPVQLLRMTLPSLGLAAMVEPHLDSLPISLDYVGPGGITPLS